uniref:Ig-like domain-containing protein n=1 Tax=Oreochromis aureus TaxID=47969 RepID=A0A668RKZ7_OREAU
CMPVLQKTHLQPQASVYQDKVFILADVGENVSLHCFYEGDDSAWILWYKQTLGQKPRLISTFYVYDTKITFHDEFQNNPRFKLDTENRRNNLNISDLNNNDSAGLKNPALVHQSPSETVQPGGSVTLNCTVHTGTCYEEHSVYWYKPCNTTLTEGKNDHCGRKANPQADACVYNLPMKDLNLSHAGTYYCAVDSCGRIVFGNGTKLDFESKMSCKLFRFLHKTQRSNSWVKKTATFFFISHNRV